MQEIYYYDYIGILGVSIIVITYFFLQIEKIESSTLMYSFANAFGSILIIYSLFYNWNLSSFIIEFFWILISFYGVRKRYKCKKAIALDSK